jgi:hypothetical protein
MKKIPLSKTPLLLLLLLFTTLKSYSQINYAVMHDPHFSINSSRYLPSTLGRTFSTAEVNLIDVYAWGSNNSVGYKHLKDALLQDVITDQAVKNLVGKLKGTTNIFVGAEVQVLYGAFKVKTKAKQELFSMEIGSRDRAMANLQLSKNMMKVILEGNKQFAGQTIDLTPTAINGIYFREYNIGAAVPIRFESGKRKIELRPALRLKLLSGIGNAFTKKGEVTMYTQPEGRYIDFNYNYNLNTSYPTSLNGLSGDGGWGFGTDIGIGAMIGDDIDVHVGLIDVGFLRFTRNTKNYSRNGLYHFRGVEFDLIDDTTGYRTLGFNINNEIIDPVETSNAYKTPLGMKLVFQAEYKLGLASTSKKANAKPYYQHHFFFNYVQGFQTLYNSSLVPNFSLGYLYSLKNILNLGFNINFLGYNKVGFGPSISVKGGPFVIGFGSNNLAAFIVPKAGTGADAYFNMSFNF